ncbi:transcriptional regulator [Oleiphilus messinensis]|uniref:Transcriptional regulator n=2 Tax=Oleiphilus messinensis TaxID=141451 RepID=A0A1Y0I6C9_9GAMM|nr:transcriptional regulator [Oleiphilus messinensis]
MTRQSLMDAVLELIDEGMGFASISIREVAKRSGVVPTAFYRHFTDMEDLAFCLVDEFSLGLRRVLRETRQQTRSVGPLIRQSVLIYVEHVQQNRGLFRFMSQVISGGSAPLRHSVRNELQFLANELAADVGHLNLLPDLSQGMIEWATQLVVNTVTGTTSELLDLSESNPLEVERLVDKTVRQLQIIFVGAANWQPIPKRTPELSKATEQALLFTAVGH